jgi:hypothetical protein
LRILPVALRGRSSTKKTCLGTLKGAMRSRARHILSDGDYTVAEADRYLLTRE